jgi:hypothetical protein
LPCRRFLAAIEPQARRFFPRATEWIYRGAGTLFFFGALVMIVAAVVALSFKNMALAEQLAIIIYFCVVFGTVRAVWAMRAREANE